MIYFQKYNNNNKRRVASIFKTLKNKPTRVIIEGVRDGAALRVLLLPNSQFPFTYITTLHCIYICMVTMLH
jgi:hypothetical protein